MQTFMNAKHIAQEKRCDMLMEKSDSLMGFQLYKNCQLNNDNQMKSKLLHLKAFLN